MTHPADFVFHFTRQFRESPDRNLIIPYSAIELPNKPVQVKLVASSEQPEMREHFGVWGIFPLASSGSARDT